MHNFPLFMLACPAAFPAAGWAQDTPPAQQVKAKIVDFTGPKPTIPGEIFLTPPDDLRFLFGVRFDASIFTGLLSKIGGQ